MRLVFFIYMFISLQCAMEAVIHLFLAVASNLLAMSHVGYSFLSGNRGRLFVFLSVFQDRCISNCGYRAYGGGYHDLTILGLGVPSHGNWERWHDKQLHEL